MSENNEKRLLKINPDLFSMSNPNNTTRNKKPKDLNKIKIKSDEPKKKIDSLKKKSILNMIRKQQEERYKKLFEEQGNHKPSGFVKKDSSSDTVSNSIFQEATEFLNHLSQKKEEDVKRNYTVKQYPSRPLQSSVSIPTPIQEPIEVYQKPVPLPVTQWGCLKGGNLPTYRNFINKTRSNQPIIYVGENAMKREPLSISNPNNQIANTSTNTTLHPVTHPTSKEQIMESKINDSLQRVQTAMKIKDALNLPVTRNKIKKRKKTKRRTHKVGKSKIAPKIGVLVSNKTIRNYVNLQSQQIKQTPIEEIKRFLIKHGMIKVGSIAPNDVLRKMYESATLMCGEVYNHNKETLLYNFIHDDKI
jgi:hypothetical protein